MHHSVPRRFVPTPFVPTPMPTPGPPRPAPVTSIARRRRRLPDPAVLLASLCETSTRHRLPLIAAATGSHPITWTPLERHALATPVTGWAIGVIGGGTTSRGEDVVAALVVDIHGRQRAVIWRDGQVIDTAEPEGTLVGDCREALGLPRRPTSIQGDRLAQ